MGEGIDHETVRVFAETTFLFAFTYFIFRAVILDKARQSKERIKRLDGRKDAE